MFMIMRVFKLLNKLVSVAKTYLNKITVHVFSSLMYLYLKGNYMKSKGPFSGLESVN